MQPPQQIDPSSLNDYLEVMSKAVFQSGMSWKVVEAKWQTTREAFFNFDVDKVASMNNNDIEGLTSDPRVIRNYRKLAAVVSNAQQMLALDKKYGTFQNYLRSQKDFGARLEMIRKDFKFMGSMGIYYFLFVVKEDVPPHEEFEARYHK